MGDFIYFLMIQMIVLILPGMFWYGIAGGTVKGHIIYVQELLNKVTELASEIDSVTPQMTFPKMFNYNVYDKYSESIKPWLFSSTHPDSELDKFMGPDCNKANDRKFLNLLYSENMA